MGRIKVLVVDDDVHVLRALVWQLELFADVMALSSVSTALALLERERFDVVVADLRMPERWGDELLAYVAARSPRTHRLLLTGDLDPQHTVSELLEHRVIEAYFVKPDFEGVVQAIHGIALTAPGATEPAVT